MNDKHEFDEELLDLLTERALGTLSAAGEARLRELLRGGGYNDGEDMELAAAAAMNAFAAAEASSADAPKPDGLDRKLQADADRFFGDDHAAPDVADLKAARTRHAAEPPAAPTRAGLVGWAVAACLAVVVLAVALRTEVGSGAPEPAAARAALLAEEDTTVVAWNQSDIPAYRGVRGDVVWNDERQEGYLRLTGMPANDPGISQYQLWIVDPERDENPVDGGVFDVPRGAEEIIIPITAKLAVSDPEAFAITREQPGGVVVSDGPLLVVAAG